MSITQQEMRAFAKRLCADPVAQQEFQAIHRDEYRLARAIRGSQVLTMIAIGDIVKLSANMSPKYLANARGTVTEVIGSSVTVKLIMDGRIVRVSASALTKVAA